MKTHTMCTMLVLSVVAVWSLQRDVHSDEQPLTGFEEPPTPVTEPIPEPAQKELPLKTLPAEPVPTPLSLPDDFERNFPPDSVPGEPLSPPTAEDSTHVLPVYPPVPDSIRRQNRRRNDQPSDRNPNEFLPNEPNSVPPAASPGKLTTRERWLRLSEQYADKLTPEELDAKVVEMEKLVKEAEAAAELRALTDRLEVLAEKFPKTPAGTQAKQMLNALRVPETPVQDPSPFEDALGPPPSVEPGPRDAGPSPLTSPPDAF